MGARERGLCLWGLKVSAILEKPALQRACVFVRMQGMRDRVGVTRVCFVKCGGRRANVGRGGEPPVCDLKVSECAVEREVRVCGCVSEEWR